MKINLLLGFLFITMIIIASENSVNDPDLIGGTELNGNGCVCHTVERDFSVDVWVEGPDTLYVGEIGLYKMYLAGGPAEAGGYNVAGRFGEMVLVDSFSFQHPMAKNELTQAFSLPFTSAQDTIFWEFGYLASDASLKDTIYSCGLSLVWDTIPDPLDRWNFGPKFPIKILDEPIPVELISFSANQKDNSVQLRWITITERNNAGFELERQLPVDYSAVNSWEKIDFIVGNGTTSESNNYSYIDIFVANGLYNYRLKQIDYDGTFKYSNIIQVEVKLPNNFSLEQNYPNPFNPSTKIKFTIPVVEKGHAPFVQLIIYDVLGNEIATLVNEEKPAGTYEVVFNASEYPSGIYFYRLQAGTFVETKKMILLR